MRLSSELAACQMSILAEKADFLPGDSADSLAGLKKKKKKAWMHWCSMQVFAPNPRPAKCVRNPFGNFSFRSLFFPIIPSWMKLSLLVLFKDKDQINIGKVKGSKGSTGRVQRVSPAQLMHTLVQLTHAKAAQFHHWSFPTWDELTPSCPTVVPILSLSKATSFPCLESCIIH